MWRLPGVPPQDCHRQLAAAIEVGVRRVTPVTCGCASLLAIRAPSSIPPRVASGTVSHLLSRWPSPQTDRDSVSIAIASERYVQVPRSISAPTIGVNSLQFQLLVVRASVAGAGGRSGRVCAANGRLLRVRPRFRACAGDRRARGGVHRARWFVVCAVSRCSPCPTQCCLQEEPPKQPYSRPTEYHEQGI